MNLIRIHTVSGSMKTYRETYSRNKNNYLCLGIVSYDNIYHNGGTLDRSDRYPIGINYEAGKIITYQDKCSNCVAWANCQIGMDAPYHGRVADESVRGKGRSELYFEGYREDRLIENLMKIFGYIKERYPNLLLVVQIARGRSWEQMYREVVEPVLKKLDISNYRVQNGYRTVNYFDCRDLEEDFIFVNIGMFAVLTDPDYVYIGELCNPVQTWNILSYDKINRSFEVDPIISSFDEDKNILNRIPGIKKIKLFGIADCMDFITPDVYHRNAIDDLIDVANV